MTVNVIGLGYIGLPTALMLAANGVTVCGTDYNEELIASLNSGVLTFEEKGLSELFKEAKAGKLNFSNNYARADVYIVAVPTPYEKETRKIDPGYVRAAVSEILRVCEKGAVIAIESTISPGTVDAVVRPLVRDAGYRDGADIHLAHVPERILPGNMLYELVRNSRTIGADDEETAAKLEALYKTFCKGTIVKTDIRTAEMSKVVENTFRDVNIAFANELARICRAGDMDVYEIIKIANMHPRVNILAPGPGVGGHCISVDPWFLVGDYPDETKLISAAREVNDGAPGFVLRRIREIMAEHEISDFSRVGLYGLTYKENVDDTRESPGLQLISRMETEGISDFTVYDPFVKRDITGNQVFSLDEFLSLTDLVVLLVAHDEILENAYRLREKIVFDTRCAIKDIPTIKL